MTNNIYIFGTGRWAQEFIQYISKSKNNRIFIISKKKHVKLWVKKNKLKDIFFLNQLPINKPQFNSKVFILSLVKDHYSQIRISLKNKYKKIFVEKPIVKNKQQFHFIKNHKKKFFISRIFSYDDKLNVFLKNLDNSKIKSIKIIWHDPPKEKRRDKLKFQDKSIKYSFDILPHIINILDIVFGYTNNKPKKFYFDIDSKNKSNFKFSIKNVKVSCDLSRISKRKRIIEIKINDVFYVFDFTNNQNYILKKIIKGKIKKIRVFKTKLDNLKKMIFSFLGENNKFDLLNFKYSQTYFKNYSKFFK